MRMALLVAAAGLLGGCAADLPTGTRIATSLSGTGDLQMPVRSMEDRKFSGTVRQRYDFSCGSAALATLLRFHYGRPLTEQATFVGMWRDGDRAAIRRVGFSLLDMKRYLAGIGLRADGYKVPLDQVRKTGLPGIALITVSGYRHFVVVKGVTEAEVLLGDPSAGLRVLPRAAFEQAWNGVYFVLNAEQPRGRTAFNQAAQWAELPRAPLGAQLADPVSQQALALTAPFYRDF